MRNILVNNFFKGIEVKVRDSKIITVNKLCLGYGLGFDKPY